MSYVGHVLKCIGYDSRLRYCFKKCVSDKRKKSTDFLDLQEIKTTKTKKV